MNYTNCLKLWVALLIPTCTCNLVGFLYKLVEYRMFDQNPNDSNHIGFLSLFLTHTNTNIKMTHFL